MYAKMYIVQKSLVVWLTGCIFWVCDVGVQAGCRSVVDALTANTTLLQLDLRFTGCTPELMHCANTLLMRNRQQAQIDVNCDTPLMTSL